MVETLVGWGYTQGEDVRGAPYDWRRAPSKHPPLFILWGSGEAGMRQSELPLALGPLLFLEFWDVPAPSQSQQQPLFLVGLPCPSLSFAPRPLSPGDRRGCRVATKGAFVCSLYGSWGEGREDLIVPIWNLALSPPASLGSDLWSGQWFRP